MGNYKEYTIELKMRSSLGTPLQADSLFGHICWAVTLLSWDVESKIEEFLSLYDQNSVPPLLISSGFPQGFLPCPVLPPVQQEFLDEHFKRGEDRVKYAHKIKALKRAPYLPKSAFVRLQQEGITSESLFSAVMAEHDTIMHELNRQREAIVQHNTVNRFFNTVTTGLYAQAETFFSHDGGVFEVFLKTNYFSRDDLSRIFSFIQKQGFGRDKGTGKGFFDFKIFERIDLGDFVSAVHFMTLSPFVPTIDDPTEGFYHLMQKYGKLGGYYANDTTISPFKVPLLMFTPGSVLRDPGFNTNKRYGQLLKNVHHDQRIRHYAYAFPLGLNVRQNYEYQ